MKTICINLLLILCLSFEVTAQKRVPFQMPETGNKEVIYNDIDFYHFSTVAFDSKNRPYGFNIQEEFGYIRTLRNGLWVKLNYLDELQAVHPGRKITNCHTKNTHAQCRITITSDDHLYVTINYLVDGETCWSIMYLDDLETDKFQVELMPGVTSIAIEEFTGYNLKNGETPCIAVSRVGKSLAELGWPTRTVTRVTCFKKYHKIQKAAFKGLADNFPCYSKL